jgi:hypothetical protein
MVFLLPFFLALPDFSIIKKGGLLVQQSFITSELIAGLQCDISLLRQSNAFQPSGLSNRVSGDANVFGPSDRLTCTITGDLGGDRELRRVVEEQLTTLQVDLQNALLGSDARFELAEQYYSISPTGSLLPRHMDERHEQTKGEKGWTNDSRRSISWLLYLNDKDWGGSQSYNAGGEFRAYCRQSTVPSCGSHEGNLQVGWLSTDTTEYSSAGDEGHDKEFDPVFLDSWVKTPTLTGEEEHDAENPHDSLQWCPLSALYRLVKNNSKEEPQEQRYDRDYLSDAFGADSPSWPSDTNLEAADFCAALALQLPASMRDNFIGTEEIHSHPLDVAPTGGTLVLFDSVAIPHEVLPTQKGERLAMAGWFHELQQPFPEWYGT